MTYNLEIEDLLGEVKFAHYLNVLEGLSSIYDVIGREEIFKYKDKFYYIDTGGNFNIIEDKNQAIKIILKLILNENYGAVVFNLKEIIEKIKGKKFQYNNPFIYFSDERIFKGLKKSNLLDLIKDIYSVYANNYDINKYIKEF